MNMRKSSGAKTDPWCTPLTTGSWPDTSPSKVTCCILLLKKAETHFQVFPLIPQLLSFHSNFLWGTLSNALENSGIIKSVCMLECRLLSSSWLSVEKGERYLASNYRPVWPPCICCKRLEHIVVSNILKHLDLHNILVDCQHGFRAKRSCETQLLTLSHELLSNLHSSIQTDLIILDFSKAFDKVPHKKLLWKLTGRSFMNMRKSSGPKTDPWGTPLTTGSWPDTSPSKATCCILLLKKAETHFQVFPLYKSYSK
jgi:hypothetical protein